MANIYSMGQVDVGGTPAKDAAAAPTPTVKTPAATIPAPAVFTGAKATDFLNTQIIPTMQNGQQSIAEQAKIKADADKIAADAAAKKAADDAAKKVTTETKTTDTTAPVGTKTAYKADGSSVYIPIGANATDYGYADTKPADKPVVATAELASGTLVKQFNDGTYGLYNPEGQLLRSATATEFTNAQNTQSTLDKINQAINGNYPLTPEQNSQIQAVKDSYARLMKLQETANANYTGGTTIAQNLYGMNNSAVGMGEIKGTIDEGVAKITDIQSKMNSDIASMTSAFKTQNLAALKSAYESFSANQSELQKNIDATHNEIVDAEKQAQQNQATIQSQIDNDIRSLMAAAAKGGATLEQLDKMKESLLAHDYQGAVKAAGDTTVEFSAAGKEYQDYKREALKAGQTPIGWDEYQTRDANRKARIAAAGASIAAGTSMTTKQQSVFNSIVDKQNKSPLVMANDRAIILKGMTDAVAADPSNSALQVSFIYSMVQALDTYQSAVREGEIGLIQGTQGLGEKLANVPSQIQNGNPLNPEVVKRYVAVAKTLTNTIASAAEQKKNAFRAQADLNGIGEQYTQWDNTVAELNKKTIGQQALDENAQAQGMSDDDLINGMSGETGTTAKTDNKSFFDGL